MKLYWYCGYYYGEPHWHGDYYEPDECGMQFETEVDSEEWKEGECCAICPKCRNILTQCYDAPEAEYETVG